jgi:6-phosphogluconolactonase/glucosamine-6-phosphate isomerase/deaminase
LESTFEPPDRAWRQTGLASPSVADRPARGDNVYVLDPIELDPKPLKPDLPGSVVARASEDDLIDAITADILLQARACVQKFGDFHLAVPSSPALNGPFRRLMYDPNYRSMPWKRTHLWQTDERCVAIDDPNRAWPRIRDLIVEPSDIPDLQAHPIAAADPGSEAEYERELTACLEWREKGHDRLDCVLLTLDERGCVAGLTPGLTTYDESALVGRFKDAQTASITMTRRLINASRFIAIWAVGERVRPVIEQIESRSACEADVPAVGISPIGGELRWYVDRLACGG